MCIELFWSKHIDIEWEVNLHFWNLWGHFDLTPNSKVVTIYLSINSVRIFVYLMELTSVIRSWNFESVFQVQTHLMNEFLKSNVLFMAAKLCFFLYILSLFLNIWLFWSMSLDSSYGNSPPRYALSEWIRCRFDYLALRNSGIRNDKFAPIRELFKAHLHTLFRLYWLHKTITIDWQLFPSGNRCAFLE